MDNETAHNASSSHDNSESPHGVDPVVIVVPVVILAVIAVLFILYKRYSRYFIVRFFLRRAQLSARGSHEPKMFPDLDRERERVLLIRSQRVSAGAALTSRPPHELSPRPRAAATAATLLGGELRVAAQLTATSPSIAMTKAATLQPRLLRHLDEELERVEAVRRLGRSAGVLLPAPPPLDPRVRPVSAPPVSRLSS